MSVYFMVLGSSIEACRPDWAIGKTLAEGWSEPSLQKAGLSLPRTEAANHTRPCLSNMPLWLLERWLQIFSSPQYGDGMVGVGAAEAWNGGPNDSGPFGSSTLMRKVVAVCVFGSRIGMSSLEYSGDP